MIRMPNLLTTLMAVSALTLAANANTWRRLDDHDDKCPDSEGTNHCKGPPETKYCASLKPFITEGGCYRECAKEWNSTTIQSTAKEYGCAASDLNNWLTDQCPGENNNECGFEMTGCNVRSERRGYRGRSPHPSLLCVCSFVLVSNSCFVGGGVCFGVLVVVAAVSLVVLSPTPLRRATKAPMKTKSNAPRSSRSSKRAVASTHARSNCPTNASKHTQKSGTVRITSWKNG